MPIKKHSFAKAAYKQIYNIGCTYVILLSILALISVWAGFLVTIIVGVLFVVLIILKLACFNSEKEFYGIYDLVKNQKCDVGDYIEVSNAYGKIDSFHLTYLELIDNDGYTKMVKGSELNNLVNNSRNVIDIKVISHVSINKKYDEIRSLLEKELPLIIEDYPMILEGPSVMGVANINLSEYELIISAKTKYEDIEKVKSAIQTRIVELIGK